MSKAFAGRKAVDDVSIGVGAGQFLGVVGRSGAGKPTLLRLIETLLIAYLGTVLGAAAGFLACFLAAGNLGVSLWVQFCTRRLLEFCPTVPEIVFALVFVVRLRRGAAAWRSGNRYPLGGSARQALRRGG